MADDSLSMSQGDTEDTRDTMKTMSIKHAMSYKAVGDDYMITKENDQSGFVFKIIGIEDDIIDIINLEKEIGKTHNLNKALTAKEDDSRFIGLIILI